MGNPEINSNNPDSILQTVKINRKSKFFRHLAKQYCWLYCSFFVMENHIKDGFSRDMSRLSPSDFNKLVLSCLVQHWASFWYKSNPKFYVVWHNHHETFVNKCKHMYMKSIIFITKIVFSIFLMAVYWCNCIWVHVIGCKAQLLRCFYCSNLKLDNSKTLLLPSSCITIIWVFQTTLQSNKYSSGNLRRYWPIYSNQFWMLLQIGLLLRYVKFVSFFGIGTDWWKNRSNTSVLLNTCIISVYAIDRNVLFYNIAAGSGTMCCRCFCEFMRLFSPFWNTIKAPDFAAVASVC